ncbi:MAG: esterase, partial [Armatimonadetes bacterium]|nr:esterase [Armatimonadota bacterium]
MSRPVPLVLVFHGGFGTGQGMVALTGFNDLADRQGFLVAYPDGVDRHWSDGRGTTTPERQEVDDVGFVAALIAELIQTHAVDP